MRLFHVSEESDISEFSPRIPYRNDLDKSVGLAWAVDEKRLPNFLTPRNCPRVTYHVGENTTKQDKLKFFSSSTQTYAVVIESKWLEVLRNTTLYVYEFDSGNFELQDNVAGYYVSQAVEKPINKFVFDDLLTELIKRNIEIRIVDNLWTIAEQVKTSTLNWSLCRMAFAQFKL